MAPIDIAADHLQQRVQPPASQALVPAATVTACAICAKDIEADEPIAYVTITTLGKHQVAIHESCDWRPKS